MIALIPARLGSKRVPGKNTRDLAGHPLIEYTIVAAQESGVFSHVVTVLECNDGLGEMIANAHGAEVFVRSSPTALDGAPDIQWVREAVTAREFTEHFAILRPTSPFRTTAMIQRAYEQFQARCREGSSLRAVELAPQTPFKMWRLQDFGPIVPVLYGYHADGTPYHSSPSQTLPVVYVQNASLEMSWTTNVTKIGTLHGRLVYPFFTEGLEGFDINTEADWRQAETLAHQHPCPLPRIPTHVR